MQEIDAQRRMAILRGEVPPPLPEPEEDTKTSTDKRESTEARISYSGGGTRKRRKRAGEDDTEFELRLANERLEPATSYTDETRKPTSSAPITDRAGHFDLFGDEKAGAHTEKNEDAEKEKKNKQREFEDQYTMRFSNAAGKGGLDKPWYSNSSTAGVDRTMKDVWGNEDPKRKERDTQRMVSNDPLAMMKKGASKVRELKQERKKFQEERDEELRQLRKEQDRKERHSRRDKSARRDRSPRDAAKRRHRSRERHDDDEKYDRERRRKHREPGNEDRRHRRRSRSPEHRRHRHRHET